MRKIIAVAAILSLAACAQEEAADTADAGAAEEEIVLEGDRTGF